VFPTNVHGRRSGELAEAGQCLVNAANHTNEVPVRQMIGRGSGWELAPSASNRVIRGGVVARFPIEALGQWTWVLVRSQDWKPLVKMLGLSADSPAFTCLETRTTFIEEALVAKVPNRGSELVVRWHMGMRDLLDYTVQHEMGHGICSSRNEDKANHIAAQLQQRKGLVCQASM
jgi:hypothetical protein